MLLRRITKHVKDQNWFAVGIDFVIVVIGVFIGIQVANWNDASQERLTEAQYLERFAAELELTIEQIQEERAFSESALTAIQTFSTRLYDAPTTDEELIEATNGFLSEGAFFAKFKPHRTTFDDLVTTGNFDIISNEAIRTALTKLHATYDTAEQTIESNIEWIQQGEDRVYYEFDAFRFDARTRPLFDEASQDELAEDVRNNRELLRRHAAFHYWLKVRSIELYVELEPEAQAALDLIHQEMSE